MAMYECEECGQEYGNFPQVMMAVNSREKEFPNHHDNVFEEKFNEIFRPGVELQEAWDKFYAWLGDNRLSGHDDNSHTKWFCTKECAVKYLNRAIERKEK